MVRSPLSMHTFCSYFVPFFLLLSYIHSTIFVYIVFFLVSYLLSWLLRFGYAQDLQYKNGKVNRCVAVNGEKICLLTFVHSAIIIYYQRKERAQVTETKTAATSQRMKWKGKKKYTRYHLVSRCGNGPSRSCNNSITYNSLPFAKKSCFLSVAANSLTRLKSSPAYSIMSSFSRLGSD